MNNIKKATVVIGAVVSVLSNKKIRKTLFGEYSDGTPKSFMDSIDGEILSPKDKEKLLKKKRNKKKHKK